MGAGQSQGPGGVPDDTPKVVRIERTEIPEEYQTVGVSHEVVNRVLAAHGGGDAHDEAGRLKEQLRREQEANANLREQMRYLTELQQRTPSYTPSGGVSANISLEEMDERKRVFNETIDRVEELFFGYQRENACESNEQELMECLTSNKTRLLNCAPLVSGYEDCVAQMRARVLAEVGSV